MKQIKLYVYIFLSLSWSANASTFKEGMLRINENARQAIIIPIFRAQIKATGYNDTACGITARNDIRERRNASKVSRLLLAILCANYWYTHEHAGCTIWYRMQTHLRKYVCSIGRKEASRSECYETLDVGCPASSVSHLLYSNTVGVAGQLFRQRVAPRVRFPRRRSPGMLVVQPSVDTLRDSIKSNCDNTIARCSSEISLAPLGGIERVDIATTMLALPRQVR